MIAPGGAWRDRLLWSALGLVALAMLLPLSRPVFTTLFPWLDRPVYEQEPFLMLIVQHLALVGASSAAAILVGVGAGIFATRPAGIEFRATVESIATVAQTFPPVAVLALAVPATGFGARPAVIALALYGLFPILRNTIAGLGTVPASVREAARAAGMTQRQMLLRIELPLALPLIVTGIRVSVIIGVGTAAIASTVGAKTLGSPIIVGLNGGNIAYVLQGAILVALLAIVIDLAFERLLRALQPWRST